MGDIVDEKVDDKTHIRERKKVPLEERFEEFAANFAKEVLSSHGSQGALDQEKVANEPFEGGGPTHPNPNKPYLLVFSYPNPNKTQPEHTPTRTNRFGSWVLLVMYQGINISKLDSS